MIAHSPTKGPVFDRAPLPQGLYADRVVFSPSISASAAAANTSATLTCTLYAADGVTVVTEATVNATLGPESSTTAFSMIYLSQIELWSVPRPYLHTLVSSVAVGGTVVDRVNTSVGFRGLSWDADSGLFVNEQPVKMRGFCNHESFAGVGAALADRIDLFRIQQLRGVGGNAWRTRCVRGRRRAVNA